MQEKSRIGKYRVLKILGQGGEGCVYLVQDENLSRPAALKKLWDQEEGKENGQIGREAAFLCELHHPMLPVVYELFYEEGWYLAMEYVEGISLHKYIKTHGPVDEERGRLWAISLLDVLTYLHTRKTPVIYKDLKPDNIMVCRDGGLRLVDFGAAEYHSFGEKADGRMAYTEGFAAPEQQGAGGRGVRADERSDIYAFGKTLYYMLTGADPGKAPYTAFPVYAYNPLLSAELEEIIRRCIAREPEARYQVAREAARDLEKRGRRRGGGKREFVRHVEKQIYLAGAEDGGF